MKRPFPLVPALVLLASLPLSAGETGSVSGLVTDAGGGALPAVTVRVVGPQLPAGRTTVTTASGAFSFQRLLPGDYTVSAGLAGLGTASRSLLVSVDRDVQVELALRGAAAAAVDVTAAAVDTTSVTIGTSLRGKELEQLPLNRTYAGLLALIPGAARASGYASGYVPIAGGTRQDNTYLVDGVNITNPAWGAIGIETNELDILEVDVKTGGISAEFGRSQGAVVNAVTRSGSNEVIGGVRFEVTSTGLAAAPPGGTTQDVRTLSGAANLGFPLVKSALFGYVSARYLSVGSNGRSSPYGQQPDSKATTQDYFGKLTAVPGESLVASAGVRLIPIRSTGSFSTLYDAPSAAFGADQTNALVNATVTWLASKEGLVEARYVHTTENDTTQAETLLPDQPRTIDPLNLGRYGAYFDPTRAGGNTGVYPYASTGNRYVRNRVELAGSWFAGLGPTRHQVKAGGGADFVDYDFLAVSNGWGVLRYGSATEVRARYYRLEPEQLGRARTYSAFLQDTVTWSRLAATLGVLVNREEFAEILPDGTRQDFLTFRWADEVQPRIGLAWSAGLLEGDKLYTSYGEYAGLDQKSTVRSMAPYRIRMEQAVFDRRTGAWQSEQIVGSSAGKYVPPDLAAPYQQEWVIGYSAALSRVLAFDVHCQYRNLKDPFEDTPVDPNKYTGAFQAKTFPDARRVYRGVTLEATKRYANRWFASLSYTYSELYGNWDEDLSTGIYNTSSFLEDEPGTNSAEPNRFGRLGMDRPHLFKLYGSYELLGATFGGLLRIESGRAWEAHGYSPNTQLRYLEPAGSRRLPTWVNLDLLAAYTLDLGRSTSLRLEARVTNVFNTLTPTSADWVLYLDPYVNGSPPSTLGPQGTSQPNPAFGTYLSWVEARRLTLAALFSF